MFRNAIITGSGSFIPIKSVSNDHFASFPFCDKEGKIIDKPGIEMVEQFEQITGIKERRYVEKQSASEIATLAVRKALEDAELDKEKIDVIIVAHNFGDVHESSGQSDMVPNLGSRIKHNLGIENPNCIPYDILFGCPGWLQAMIQAEILIRSGEAEKCVVVGTETLSKVVDPFDRDTMIFADGAGAVVLESKEEDFKRGVIAHCALSHTKDEAYYLKLGKSYNGFDESEKAFVKMDGRKIYNYALTNVPDAMIACIDKAGLKLKDINKILIHQANEKMDEAIVRRLFKKCNLEVCVEEMMPMSIARLGNSSVATIPTLYDMICRGRLNSHTFKKDDNLLFASVGAGMNINAMVYRV